MGNNQSGSSNNLAKNRYPVKVSGGHEWESVTTGYSNSCGIKTNGHVMCWGKNLFGQVGNNSTNTAKTPQRVRDPNDTGSNWTAKFESVTGGYDSVFALRKGTEQSISFPEPSPTPLTAGPLTELATASSGLSVSYTSNTPLVCEVSGGEVILQSLGTCTLVASQAGNANYLAAPDVTTSFAVLAADQSIDFPNPGPKNPSDFTGDGMGLSAWATS
ncbi:MAG: hypothetical protein GY888_28255, partial [Planctomycetaceae bacterium]|nr:hypothetical protein [Planctomycetaceae bacterium]